ncbi:hypothetical protein M407DRAFT_34585 [Tulasnella calospora MUT 4182]|uniref:F-box domain-containing protein n=1 Tax=Tulasnella calospora MUT 4182 TaxID=1051891 RepID=A0A0C3K313_9AGAM|nr:hypothetical protein M407DRAFT_34585 [Tulasnella calospora MUT 4182]
MSIQMDPNDIDSQVCSGNEAAASGKGDDVEEPGSHRGYPQETNASSQLDLLTERESFVPIHSLPTEVLFRVIRNAMLWGMESVDEDYYRCLVHLSGVCSRWYHLIRDSPSLWTRIHGSDSPEILKLALKRSSGRALDIILYADTLYKVHDPEASDHLELFLAALRSHIDRWRSMDILFPPLWADDIITTLEEPALKLEKLSIWAQDVVSSAHEIDFFAGTAPRLNDLTLNGVSICWDSEVIHNLTALNLSYIHFPSTEAILHALSHSPHLQTLIIDRCTTSLRTNTSSPSIQPLQLSVLQVDLGSPDATEDFLSHIEDDRDDAPSLLLSRRKKTTGIPEV